MSIEEAFREYEFITYSLSFLTAPRPALALDMESVRFPAQYVALVWLLFIQFMTLYVFAIVKLLRWAERYEAS